MYDVVTIYIRYSNLESDRKKGFSKPARRPKRRGFFFYLISYPIQRRMNCFQAGFSAQNILRSSPLRLLLLLLLPFIQDFQYVLVAEFGVAESIARTPAVFDFWIRAVLFKRRAIKFKMSAIGLSATVCRLRCSKRGLKSYQIDDSERKRNS